MYFPFESSAFVMVVHVALVLAIGVRVVMRRSVRGVALSWLLLVVTLPVAGAVVYLLIGERRIGRRRTHAITTLRTDFRQIARATIPTDFTAVPWSDLPAAAQAMDRLGRSMIGFATVRGNSFEMVTDTQAILARIVRDIDAARTSVLMEFYIWSDGGAADDVVDAVIRAAARGVQCRLLVDALGARPWWKGRQPKRLRDAGVQLRSALPTGLFRTLIGRTDLRLHRKIVVIDGMTAWTGSMNLVDPRYFKQESGVGEWVDAMVRFQGAVVNPLAGILVGDWILETGEPLHELIAAAGLGRAQPLGTANVQIVPSGPGESEDGLLQMILGLINAARHELVLTTPYLVPDDSMILALRGAAGRGVQVTLIVPEKVDSFLTRYASRSYYDDLLDAGVVIQLYRGGLLHTKSIAVDGAMSMFGTVNLDMRSLWLNYEVALFIYHREFTETLRTLQKSYALQSTQLDPTVWAGRPFRERLIENTLRLFSPLL
ncbi:cardiolipin synthase [Reyranella sp.]|uniref:cardiolipin synthase n=1 Tax=Reyranella sp. TaxID=1929291 RepID=UPI003D0F289E